MPGLVPGIQVFMQNPPPIRIGGQFTKSLYQFTLQSPDTRELYRESSVLEEKMRGLAQLQDVTSDLQMKNPQGDWSFYLQKNGEVRWSDVIFIGHSHGATSSAAYAKVRRVWRAI